MSTTATPKTLTFDQAIKRALKIALTRDPKVILASIEHTKALMTKAAEGVVEQVLPAAKKNPNVTDVGQLMKLTKSIAAATTFQKRQKEYAILSQDLAELRAELQAANNARM